jgi:uncharacterized protein YegL
MRRLPIFLLVDVDGPIPDWHLFVSQALTAFIQKLRHDPWALDVGWLSLIIISKPPVQVFPLTELTEVTGDEFLSIFSKRSPCGSLGETFKLTTDCIVSQCRPRTATEKGDWRPIVLSIVGYAHLRDISEGIAALASAKPAISSVFCLSEPAANPMECFSDCSTHLKPEDTPESVGEWLWTQYRSFNDEISDFDETAKNNRNWRDQTIPKINPVRRI